MSDDPMVQMALNRGVELWSRGIYDLAIQEFTSVLDSDPQNPKAYGLRGICYWARKEYQDALDDLTEAIRMSPLDPNTFNNRAMVCKAVGNLEQGLADLRRAVDLDPTNGNYLHNYGQMLMLCSKSSVEQGRLPQAREELQQAEHAFNSAVELLPQLYTCFNSRGQLYWNRGEVLKARRDYEKALELVAEGDASSQASILNNLALVAISENKNDEAIKYLTRAIELEPKDGELYASRGRIFIEEGKLSDALQDFVLAKEYSTDTVDVVFTSGQLHRRLGQIDKASSEFRSVLEVNPRHAQAALMLGKCCVSQGKNEEALQEFTKALELDSDLAEGYNSRGCLLMGSGDPDGAMSDFNMAIQLNENCVEAYVNRASLHKLRGHFPAALDDAKLALHLNPENCGIYTLVGSIHKLRGDMYVKRNDNARAKRDYSMALNHFNSALRQHSHAPLDESNIEKKISIMTPKGKNEAFAIFFGLGNLYLSKQDLSPAITNYEMALRCVKNHIGVLVNMSTVTRLMGDHYRSLELCNEALKRAPEDPIALNNRGVLYEKLSQFEMARNDYAAAVKNSTSDYLIAQENLNRVSAQISQGHTGTIGM